MDVDGAADLYEVLGVSTDAGAEELRRSYQRLALLHHPDKNGGVESAAFLAVAEAWRVLGDAARRSRYDAERKQREAEGAQMWATIQLGQMQETAGDGGVCRTYQCRCGGEFLLLLGEEETPLEEGYLVDCDTCSLSLRVIVK